MKRHLLLSLALLGLWNATQAQQDSTLASATKMDEEPSKKWKPDFKVRQSFESSDQKKEPAALLLTVPNQKASSYAIDGGLAIEVGAYNRTFWKLVGEYHRNTLIDKEQNNRQFGITLEKYFSSKNDTIDFRWILNATAKYVRDVVAFKGSSLVTAEVSPFPFKEKWLFHRYTAPGNHLLQALPSAGFEYQNTFESEAKTSDSLRGTMLRAVAKLTVSLTINKQVTVGNSAEKVAVPAVQIYANGALRYDINNTTQTPNGWHPYLQTGIDYILTRNKDSEPRLSVGLSYVSGENPAQGLARQQYGLLALRFTL